MYARDLLRMIHRIHLKSMPGDMLFHVPKVTITLPSMPILSSAACGLKLNKDTSGQSNRVII